MDDLERQLLHRDRRFLVRVALSLAVALLGGVWGLLALSEANVGGCAARGFGAVTGSASTPAPSP